MTENEADIPEVENSETLQLDEPEQDWLDDLQVSLNYLTKFSVPGGLVLSNPSIPKASRFFPVIGILIGIVSSLVIAAASLIGLPQGVVIAFGICSISAITGLKQETALANSFDLLPTIVKQEDSQKSNTLFIGVFSLFFGFVIKWIALSSISLDAASLALLTGILISSSTPSILMRYSLRSEENETLSSEADLKTVFISVILAIVICFFINGFLLTATIVLILFIFMVTIIFLMRHFIKKYDENLVLGFAEVTNIVVILTIVSSEA